MQEINFNTSWPFKLDETCFYAYWDNAFSKEECLSINPIEHDERLKEYINHFKEL